jgi:nitroreductase
MITKPAVTNEKIHDLLQNRWSPRAFDLKKPVSAANLTALLEAARWAPSCMNEQPWRFLVCDKYQNETAWHTLLTCLAEKNQQWAAHAPVLVLSVAMDRFSQNDKANRWAAYDTGAASLNLCLQATALGLVAHQMGGFDADACRQQFSLPEHCSPMAVIAIGYQAEVDGLSEEFKQRELAERTRADLNERFYFGRWG